LPYIVNLLRETRAQIKEHKKNHSELRQSHVAALAEARVLKRSPNMSHPSKILALDKAVSNEIKQLAKREQRRKLFDIINHVFNPGMNYGGLVRIDIPASDCDEPFPVGPDPKTWSGPWKSVTNPEEIASHVCAANQRQYNQAHNTPFASEPLLSYLGYNGDTAEAEALLAGTLPPASITESLLPETQQLLKTLSTQQASIKNYSSTISGEDFSNLYKVLSESTSSSPSGRHIGHYKVASTQEHLADLHAKMMSIPHLAGFSPDRWHQVVDIMLEKDLGDPKIHRLRIIALQESDFNQSNRLLLARPLTHHLEDKLLIPTMQYGSRPGKHCHSAILNKQLTFEILRQTKETAAFIENDAIGCYDRMVNPILILCLRKLGTNPKVAASLAKSWQHTIHRIKT
jgi:hypothetical protein